MNCEISLKLKIRGLESKSDIDMEAKLMARDVSFFSIPKMNR